MVGSGYNRVIMHVDLDYFYAQVEERLNPEIASKPVVVCVYSGRGGDSGAVSSANYIARNYGVKAGIPIIRAKQLLKNTEAVFLPMRKEVYEKYSEQVMGILRRYADVVEVESIDEASLDVTNRTNGDFEEALKLAHEIKQAVKNETGLTCTIGIAKNKTVAKIAADIAKPDGVRLVRPWETREFLNPLPVKKLPGVGDKLAKEFESVGLRTIGDLASADLDLLRRIVGEKTSEYLILAARGEYDEPVVEKRQRKQLSRIVTLRNNTRSVEEIVNQLEEPIEDVIRQLEESNLEAGGVGLIAITTELKTVTRSRSLKTKPTKQQVRRLIEEMLRELLEADRELVLRRAGVRLHDLKPASRQTTLISFGEK